MSDRGKESKMKGRYIDGELYWPVRCDRGHEFELGPIHDPEASEPDPDRPGGLRSVPGSGKPEHIGSNCEVPCRECRAEGEHSLVHPL